MAVQINKINSGVGSGVAQGVFQAAFDSAIENPLLVMAQPGNYATVLRLMGLPQSGWDLLSVTIRDARAIGLYQSYLFLITVVQRGVILDSSVRQAIENGQQIPLLSFGIPGPTGTVGQTGAQGPTGPAGAPAITQYQDLQILGGVATEATGIWGRVASFVFDPSDYSRPVTTAFHAIMETSLAGTPAGVRIYDPVANAVVSGTYMTTGSHTAVELVSPSVTLSGSRRTYELQIQAGSGSAAAICSGAWLAVT